MSWSFLPLAIWSLSPLLHAENIILSKGSNFHSIVSKLVSKTRIEAVTQSPRVSFVWYPSQRLQMSAIMTLFWELFCAARLRLICFAWSCSGNVLQSSKHNRGEEHDLILIWLIYISFLPYVKQKWDKWAREHFPITLQGIFFVTLAFLAFFFNL